MTSRCASLLLVPFAFFANGGPVSAETLRAAEVLSPTNTDWVALARAQRTVRTGGAVEFVWQAHPEVSFAHIRRALWIAALHGMTDQTASDDNTNRLLAPELALARKRIRTPFAFDVAVRDASAPEDLYSRLVLAQTASLLVSTNEMTTVPTILRRQTDEVISEGSGVVFTSIPMAVTFSQSCHTDNGLVFESDGRVATGLFVRRFKDGTATVVNLTDETRRDLTYRRGLTRLTFDLFPAGVVHLVSSDPPRLTRNCGERFIAGLWQVSFEGNRPQRLVRSHLLPSVANETYRGTIRYRTNVFVPPGGEMLFLHLETEGAETEVLFDGRSVGTRAWAPFDWPVPRDYCGKNVPLEIRVMKRAVDDTLLSSPDWHRP